MKQNIAGALKHLFLNRYVGPYTTRFQSFLNMENPSVTERKLRIEIRSLKMQVQAEKDMFRKAVDRRLLVQKKRDALINTVETYRAQILKLRDIVVVHRQRTQTYRAQILKQRDIIAVHRQRAQSDTGGGGKLIDMMIDGASTPDVLVTYVRDSSSSVARMKTREIASRVYANPDMRSTGAIMMGVFLFHDELPTSAAQYFADADRADALLYAPIEYLGVQLADDKDRGRGEVLAYLAENADRLTPQTAYKLVEQLIKHGLYSDTRVIMRDLAVLRNPQVCEDPIIGQKIAWVHDRLATKVGLPPKVADNQINLAIMDYKLLDRDRTSSNRGDYVQTLAALSNICRFENVTFAGDSDLAQLMTELKDDIHPDRRVDTPAATVVPVALDRDFASGRQYHPDTWLVCNGWFLHKNFRGMPDFPFPDTVNPIFLSFHVNDPDVLTADVADALRKHAPIGCRDWTTIYRLRDYGVPCFFSGCLTTTVGQVLPRAQNLPSRHLAAVESAITPGSYAGWQITEFSQVGDYVRDFTLVQGIRDAIVMLKEYLNTTAIQTSRLHCYLPCRSMGFDVDFRPRNRSDIRFEGLLELDAAAFSKIRTGIETKLEVILSAILAGQSRDDVMTLWRTICADEVAEAEVYCATFDTPAPMPGLLQAVSAMQRQQPRPLHANAVELAFAVDQNLHQYLPAVLEGIAAHTTGPVNVHLMSRGLSDDWLAKLASAFPEIGFDFMDFDAVSYGSNLRLLSHTSISTLDRLYLPLVLSDLDHVIYLDVDIMVRGDLRDLYDMPMGDAVVAGKSSSMKTWQNPVRLLTRASLALAPEKAWEMRRRIHYEMPPVGQTFNAGVIMMNLAKMRQEDFTQTTLYLVTQCACNDQDALNLYAQGRIAALPLAWNYVPVQDYCTDPKIVHWAGRIKPWDPKKWSLWKDDFLADMHRADVRMGAGDGSA